MKTLFAAARTCLDAASPDDKPARTFEAAQAFSRGELTIEADAPAPEPIRMLGRPAAPKLVHPRDLPRRGFGSNEGRAAFIHAVAHIEFNAIDLVWDAAQALQHGSARPGRFRCRGTGRPAGGGTLTTLA